MIPLEGSAGVLLCAGNASRFEKGQKLLHDFLGKPLIAFAAETIASLPLAKRIAVVRNDAPELHKILSSLDYHIVQIEPGKSQTQSVELGIDGSIGLVLRECC